MLQESQATGRAPKNIVLCFDGTGDWAATDTTNVMKIFKRLNGESQITYYTGGVGTLGNPIALSPTRRAFLKLLDLATATSLRDKVLDGYTFLMGNYEEGDKIFLFGFSRGAFTARLLAAVIHNFGLLRAEHENLAPYLWQTIDQFDSFDDFKRDSARLKEDFSKQPYPTIHFMGLFDTVSSVGVFERFKVYPYTDKNPSVKTIRHAVSQDEQRNCFPELLIIPDGNDVSEIWFPGVHRDIGGGADDHPGLSNQTLNWIVAEAKAAGLDIDDKPELVDDVQRHYAPFDPYVIAGLYPMKMFDYSLKRERRQTANLGYAAITRKVAGHGDSKDPGFRWFWPNFTHVRPRPTNAFVVSDKGQLTSRGGDLPFGDAKNLEAPTYEPTKQNNPDTIGTILGVALAFIILYKGLWEAFATAFPELNLYDVLGWPWPRVPIYGDHTWLLFSSSCAFYIFGIYVVHQMFSQRLALKVGTRWINILMPYLGILACVALALFFRPWLILYIGLVLGVIVAFVSQLGKRPVLPANRAVAYFMVPWFLIVVVFAVINYLAQLIWPYVVATVEFILLGHYAYLEIAYFQTFLVCLACLASVLILIAGLVNIVQDRRKMGEVSKPL